MLALQAARGLLGWSQAQLAKRVDIGLATLQRLEMAGSHVRGSAKTIGELQQALEAAGVIFIEQDRELGPGVRLRKPLPPL